MFNQLSQWLLTKPKPDVIEKPLYGLYNSHGYTPPKIMWIGYDKQLFDLYTYRFTFSNYFEVSIEELIDYQFVMSSSSKKCTIPHKQLMSLLASHKIPTYEMIQGRSKYTYVNIEEINTQEEKYDESIQKVCDTLKLMDYYVKQISLDNINNEDVKVMTKEVIA